MNSNSTISLDLAQHRKAAAELWSLRFDLTCLRQHDTKKVTRRKLDQTLAAVDRLRFALDESLYRDHGRQIGASYYRAHPDDIKWCSLQTAGERLLRAAKVLASLPGQKARHAFHLVMELRKALTEA